MKNKINYFPTLLFILLYTAAQGQDFHTSQFNAAPHYFNPALTGIYFGDDAGYKIYSDYRSQWKSLGRKPFSTYYLAYDMPYKNFGLGGYLINNRTGMGGMNTISFMPSGAYKISNEINSPHNLSAGAQLGIIYKSFDPNHFTYDNQYSSDASGGFDQSLSSGENFEKTSRLKIDANMGVFYKYKKQEMKVHPWVGFSVYHMTKPNQSMTGIMKDRTPFRFVAEIGADYKINEEVTIKPMIIYMNQGNAHDLNIGATGSYLLKETAYTILGGLNIRTKDAFIIQAGMKYDRHLFMISYDVNTSYLNNYTNGRGAFELSIVLSGIKGHPLFNPKFRNSKGVSPTL